MSNNDSKVDTEQMNEFKDYITTTVKEMEEKLAGISDDVKAAQTLYPEIYEKWKQVQAKIGEYNLALGGSMLVLSEEAKADYPLLSNEDSRIPNWQDTATTVKKMTTAITIFNNDINTLRGANENFEEICCDICSSISKMEKILNKSPEMRKEVLEEGIINDSALATTAKGALNEDYVGGVAGYDDAWDTKTHFIFKDGAFLVQSGESYNGFIGGATLANMAKKVAAKTDAEKLEDGLLDFETEIEYYTNEYDLSVDYYDKDERKNVKQNVNLTKDKLIELLKNELNKTPTEVTRPIEVGSDKTEELKVTGNSVTYVDEPVDNKDGTYSIEICTGIDSNSLESSNYAEGTTIEFEPKVDKDGQVELKIIK